MQDPSSKQQTKQLNNKSNHHQTGLPPHSVGKTIGLFRYEVNQILYDYTVEVRNRFKGLDLIECLMSYGRRFVILYKRQGLRPPPWKINAKKAK